jgi:heme/copper-type cytochrome/quinol oxidase subunit 2
MTAAGDNQEFEQRRTTMGLAFLVLGLVLLMWAWGSWIYRTSNAAKPIVVGHAETPEEKVKTVAIAPGMLVGGVILFVVFLAASFVFVRASRRYRQSLSRRGSPPTDTTDVWSMHKLKDFDDSGG